MSNRPSVCAKRYQSAWMDPYQLRQYLLLYAQCVHGGLDGKLDGSDVYEPRLGINPGRKLVLLLLSLSHDVYLGPYVYR
jgi:hypothetical protein